MPNLNLLLQSKETEDEKMDLMYGLFAHIKEKVSQILLYGPSNTQQAERVANIYCSLQNNKLFKTQYSQRELKVLPAVIASNWYYDENEMYKNRTLQEHLSDAYLYGTGCCESFAVIGAYFLAKEYDVGLSIETIFVAASHTYIRIHTTPEYIFDFWGNLACRYDDNITWCEVLGDEFKRTKDAEYKTDFSLDSAQLIEAGNDVFTPENEKRRRALIDRVDMKMAKLQKPVYEQIKENAPSNTWLR